VKFRAGDEVFVVIPPGFSITYCNSPIVVYEKSARTVCRFSSGEQSLVAKNIRVFTGEKGPTISRSSFAKEIESKLEIEVVDCGSETILRKARSDLSGSEPVIFRRFSNLKLAEREDLKKNLTPGKTLIWKINGQIVKGTAGFNSIQSHLEIGAQTELYLAEMTEGGYLSIRGSVKIPAVEK